MVVMFLWFVQEVAGLKEEDLPCDPPTVNEQELLVAPVPSVSHSTHMYTSCDNGLLCGI